MQTLGDYHVHTSCSPDSTERMENVVRAALASGLTEVAFTDHYDEAYPHEGFPRLDFPSYFAELSRVRTLFPQFQIRSGVELGMMRSAAVEMSAHLRGWSFDFILFSKHVVGNCDPYYPEYFSGRPLRDGERAYLTEMLDDIRSWDDFDVVGHIGYVDKFLDRMEMLPADSRPFEYEDFPDELDALLREIISRGKGIEINTSTFGSWQDAMPRRSVLKRYFALGGEIVTIGSDAHTASDVGRHFGDAVKLLEACGGRWVCTFEARRPQFHAI